VHKKNPKILTKLKMIKEIMLYFPKLDEDYLYNDFSKMSNYGLEKVIELLERTK